MLFEAVVGKSSRMFFALSLMHASGLTIFFFTTQYFLSSFLLMLFCMLSYYYCFSRYISLTHPSVIHVIRRQITGEWLLINKRGDVINATLEGDSVITNFLIIMNFKRKDKKTSSVVLFPDALGQENFRRLSVILRNVD